MQFLLRIFAISYICIGNFYHYQKNALENRLSQPESSRRIN